MRAVLIVLLLIANIPVYRKLKTWLFPEEGSFSEAIQYYFTWDVISMFRGEWGRDMMAEMTLGFYFFLVAVIVGAEYFVCNLLLMALGL